MERYELYKYLEQFEKRIHDLEVSLNLDKLISAYETLFNRQLESNFWDDVKGAQKTIEEMNDKKEKIDTIKSLKEAFLSLQELSSLVDESDDEWLIIEEETMKINKDIEDFELLILLSGEYDHMDCFLELHAGAGGTESQDWCEMLYRMYMRYAQQNKYKTETLDYQAGDEAGIKSVTLRIKGRYAYGNLKGESGVHRLVRISPFDSNKRRHTSFVSSSVTPVIDDTIDVKILDEDIKVDVYRSSGAGGQSVNTTDSAVRITHFPTGIVVTCQNERSQIQNRETAFNILKSKLIQLEEQKREEALSNIVGDQKDIAWGSQIRSYVFHPYQMVKDHRTDAETSQTSDVMDGDIELFIKSYLKWVKRHD